MLITFSPLIILSAIGLLVYIFFDFDFKSFDKTVYLLFGLFFLIIPLTIYCRGIAEKIGEKLPVHEVIIRQKEFPECGVIIEKRAIRFKNVLHEWIANVPSPQVWEVCRKIE